MQLNVIGYVRKNAEQTVLELSEPYRKGLKGLAGFSHLQVLCWGHLVDTPANREQTVIDAPYQNAPEQLGVFATRSPARPNPILLSIAQVAYVDVDSGTIGLYWVDAEPDTPLLDIKPYQACSDRVAECTAPEWCEHWPQSYEASGEFDWSQVFNY